MRTKRQLKVELARKFRKDPTKTEEKLWWILRDKNMLGYKFRRQHVVRGFILDFFCPRIRLGIEIDGGVHIKQKEYDTTRQKILEGYGIKLLRFKNSEILYNPVKVLNIISKNLPIGPLLEKERGDHERA